MTSAFILSPRYRLDDDSVWLQGIDPSRRYWLWVNGDPATSVIVPGLCVVSVSEFREIMLRFRGLQPQQMLKIERIIGICTIHCLSANCYAIEGRTNGALTWHLFDKETLEGLLMTSHPDWVPSYQDLELGRKALQLAFEQPAYAV